MAVAVLLASVLAAALCTPSYLPHAPSPALAAPEVCAGESYRGRQADIWALGVSLYLFIFGELPFKVGRQPFAGRRCCPVHQRWPAGRRPGPGGA